MEKPPRIAAIMKRRVSTIGQDEDISKAVRLMRGRGVDYLVVVSHRIPIGIVTGHDIIKSLTLDTGCAGRIADIMTRPLTTVKSQSPLIKTMNIMCCKRIRHLPVVDRGQLVGIVTQTELLEASKILLSDMKRRHMEIKKISRRDGLTGLYNRRHFHEYAEREFGKMKKNGGQLSIITIDIDHFKAINDKFGHPAGDTALRRIADFIKADIRKNDIVARCGGDEFSIICPGSDTDAAVTIAERLRMSIENTRFAYKGVRFNVTISAGICDYKTATGTMHELMRAADKALYRAKKNGRNRVSVS